MSNVTETAPLISVSSFFKERLNNNLLLYHIKVRSHMNKKIKWFDRKFDFDFPVTIYPELIVRLKETPKQLDTLAKKLPENILSRRFEKTWSIKENIGHLLTTDSLFMGRLDDYENGRSTLRPADLSNRTTSEKNYNDIPVSTILDKFKEKRNLFVNRLKKLQPADFGRTAIHPRIKKQMRLVDNCFFQAEHDDHHLNRIKELIDK